MADKLRRMLRRWLPIFLILAGGWAAFEVMTRQAGLGEHARSPQQLEIVQGRTAIAAGGRAGIVFIASPYRKRAELLVRCRAQKRAIKLRRGEISRELCNITVELIDILPGGRVQVVVRFEEGDAQDSEDPSDEANDETSDP